MLVLYRYTSFLLFKFGYFSTKVMQNATNIFLFKAEKIIIFSTFIFVASFIMLKT